LFTEEASQVVFSEMTRQQTAQTNDKTERRCIDEM